MEEDILTTLNLLIIGESGVGKTSLRLQFTEDTFYPILKPTIGGDVTRTKVSVDLDTVQLSIWDTAGTERYRSVPPSFYRPAQGAILVYDVSNVQSFNKLETWIDELEKHSQRNNIVKMIVVNKIDKKDREVSYEDGTKFARRHGTLFTETSAKTNNGVERVFKELIWKIIQTPGLWEKHASCEIISYANRNMKGNAPNGKVKSKCCPGVSGGSSEQAG